MKKILSYLVVGTLLLGGLLITAFRSPIWYDDAGHFLVANEVANGNGMCYPIDDEGTCIAGSPFITMGPMLTYPVGWWLSWQGHRMIFARIFIVFLALITALALFVLAQKLTSATKALIALSLIGLNIQFLTYGAELLGEVPMMGFVISGAISLLHWRKSGRIWAGLLGIGCWLLAVGIKEYAILPLSLALAMGWFFALVRRDRPWNWLLLTAAWSVGLMVWMLVLHGGLAGLQDYLLARKSYGSEFFAFDLGTSLKYLAFKPLFWLGTAALVVRWRVKRRMEEAFMIALQLAWLLFFLLSAGYERFGFLLLFIPAIYLAEFAPYLWKEAGRSPKYGLLRRIAVVLIALGLFGQQTFPILLGRLLNSNQLNANERILAGMIEDLPETTILTAEQQMALFMDGTKHGIRLVRIVPSQGGRCEGPHADFQLRPGEAFLAGPYAFTEYQHCIDWQALSAVDSLDQGGGKWVLYRRKK